MGLRVAGDVEGAARLHRGSHADETLGEVIALDQLLGDVPLGVAEALVRAWAQ